jgi:hypothetical protein
MNTHTSTVHYNSRGYEAVYVPNKNTCIITVRGYVTPDKKFVERGGTANPSDKPIATMTMRQWDKIPSTMFDAPKPVRETFEDVLWDRHDLVGELILRNKPKDVAHTPNVKMSCASAYKAAQKIRQKMNVIGVGKLVFTLNPSFFTFIDCFARDTDGAFWILACTTDAQPHTERLPLASYILETGEYVPTNAIVRCGIWDVSRAEPVFREIPNDRVEARNAVISHLLATPF